MEDDGVALDCEATGAALHLYHLQHLWRHGQFDITQVECVFPTIAEGEECFLLGVIA